jgi:DNA polymerase I-like protein with 3'-5' exonuclease and polymerase domains
LLEVLNDPERDMHAEQAIDVYGLTWTPEDGNPKKWCRLHGYSAQRDCAKTADFGWAYSISARGLYLKLVEAGAEDITLEDCTKLLGSLDSKYSVTRKYLRSQGKKVYDPGYVETPWGRVKHLYVYEDKAQREGQEREAGNFNIQSSVADLIRAALIVFLRMRDELNLRTRLCLDLHDAFYSYVPIEEVDVVVKKILPACMSVPIPKIDLSLGYDISAYLRWEESLDEQELVDLGVPQSAAAMIGE